MHALNQMFVVAFAGAFCGVWIAAVLFKILQQRQSGSVDPNLYVMLGIPLVMVVTAAVSFL
jgi:ABC-type Fe3+-siderophore transport system permease subunit